jgi:hypothetical protein
MILPLLLAIAQPEPSLLLTCEQFDWLVERTLDTKSLSLPQKVDFIQRYSKWTDPLCFEVKE